ncbi:MAG: alpha-L-fucosidase [Saprospiraceae bacterium]
MKNTAYFKGLLILCLFVSACQEKEVPPPTPFGPLPAEKQLAWHELEYYAFAHFNMNTFTNMEWGLGSEKPAQFNPTQLDTRQWARICKAAGMKGIIITAKHHDGFCLWPSAYTEHSVKNSPWKNGQGDLIKDLAEACKEYGLKMGIYLSPWDRNHALYGTPEYITYFRQQLRELLSNYGDIYEVWFDGANGGDGYYGGANETRKIDNKTYYDWENTIKIVEELQPNAVIFSDAGPGVRWVGNEEGWANETNWSLLRKADVYPGMPDGKQLRSGHEDGTHWIPAECDVSIRPGWYYHPYEDHKVKSLNQLVDIYYHSIGRNASFLLNLPIDTRGIIHERDSQQLMKLAATIQADFAKELAAGKKVAASNVRGEATSFSASNTLDGDPATYWATADGVQAASLEIDLGEPTTFNRFLIQEYIRLGQRVTAFTVSVWKDNAWEQVTAGTTIGYKRILRFPGITTSKVKIDLEAKAPITISTIELYDAPVLMEEPQISRSKEGLVTIQVNDPKASIHYTLDGSTPTKESPVFSEAFPLANGGIVNAITLDPSTGRQSELSSITFGFGKEKWTVKSVSSGDLNKAAACIDEDPNTWWQSAKEKAMPQEIVLDLGAILSFKGFTYLPMQQRWVDGFIQFYDFYTSVDGKSWTPIAKGEFANIYNNPIEQIVNFPVTKAQFIKLQAVNIVSGMQGMGIAELGLVPE